MAYCMPCSSRIISEIAPTTITIATMELQTGVLNTLVDWLLDYVILKSI